jgi:hypothetical protein
MSIKQTEADFRGLLKENAEILMDDVGNVRVFHRLSEYKLFSKEERADIRRDEFDCRRGVIRCLAAIFRIRQDIAECVSIRRKWREI